VFGLRAHLAEDISAATKYWWVLLITGAAWIALSLAILQFDMTSVWSIAILTGVVLCLAAATEFMVTYLAPSWKWAHALLGVLFLVGGITAFVWPGSTFVTLSRLVAWYLLFLGTFEIIESLAYRGSLWGLRLVTGIASIAIAFWAAPSFQRSATFLVLWVGIGALMRGISQIFLAFQWREVHEGASRTAGGGAVTTDGAGQQVDLTRGVPAPRPT
jgi:uncharacterized membrane protein HdeD (DUF308 family)